VASAGAAERPVLVQLQVAADPLLAQAQVVADRREAARRAVEAVSAVSAAALLPTRSYSAATVRSTT
jgi:hypothetical protein